MMYRHPASYRPPLAIGGHCWTFTDPTGFDWLTCIGCYITVPRWVLAEEFWRNFAGSYCLGALRALPRGPRPCDDCHGVGFHLSWCRERVPTMPGLCPLQGEAFVEEYSLGKLRWIRADPEIHVADELLNIKGALRYIETRYSIDERCPYDRRTRHARLRPALDWTEP